MARSKVSPLGKVEFRRPEFDPKQRERKYVSATVEATRALALFCANHDLGEREVASAAILEYVKKEGRK